MKRFSRRIARDAVDRGLIVKAKACELCGVPEVQMHHDDYMHPLVVRWVCAPCHKALHT